MQSYFEDVKDIFLQESSKTDNKIDALLKIQRERLELERQMQQERLALDRERLQFEREKAGLAGDYIFFMVDF